MRASSFICPHCKERVVMPGYGDNEATGVLLGHCYGLCTLGPQPTNEDADGSGDDGGTDGSDTGRTSPVASGQ